MKKYQVVLIPMQPLLGEGLRRIFQKREEIDLVCLECADWQKVKTCLQNLNPDMVLLAGEKEDDPATHLIADMLKEYEDIPIVWVELETNILRLYTSHSLTGNSSALIQAIGLKNARKMEVFSLEKKTRAKPRR